MNILKVVKVTVPEGSVLYATLGTADFYDAYQTLNPEPQSTALEVWFSALKKIPRWMDVAMLLRNAIVKQIGLKNVGALSAFDSNKSLQTYKVGDRVGAFTISHLSDAEVVMGDSDKHLDVSISLCKIETNQIVISTVVCIHNWVGHVYMFFVKPAHRVIAPATLSKIAN